MRRATEPIDSEPSFGWEPRALQRPVADDPRTQQRRCLRVAEDVGQVVRELPRRRRRHRRSSVSVHPVKCGALQRFSTIAPAVLACTARTCEPRHPNSIADREPRAAFRRPPPPSPRPVARHDERSPGREVPLREVEVGAAHAAHVHANPELAATRARELAVHAAQGVRVDRPRVPHCPREHHRRPPPELARRRLEPGRSECDAPALVPVAAPMATSLSPVVPSGARSIPSRPTRPPRAPRNLLRPTTSPREPAVTSVPELKGGHPRIVAAAAASSRGRQPCRRPVDSPRTRRM